MLTVSDSPKARKAVDHAARAVQSAVMLSGRAVAVFLLMAPLPPSLLAQQSEPTASQLLRFDNQHDLALKDRLLLTLTNQDKGAGPALLQLAESTTNSDTRWMAMRGMATLQYVACAPFLEASLKDSDSLVRANAARALGDLRIRDASGPLLSMFAAEQDPAAIQQASLALRMLQIKAAAPYPREKIAALRDSLLVQVKGAAPYPREKIAAFTGQTRFWLIQALGTLGDAAADVPLIAEYLGEKRSDMAAMEAMAELTGVSFGPRTVGLSGDPTPETVAARAWWQSHKAEWPRCGDCHQK